MDGEELSEVGLRVSQEGTVSICMMGETLRPFACFWAGQQDPDLRRPDVIWEVLIGC